MVLPVSDRNPTRRTPVLTVLLIAANVAVYFLFNFQLPDDQLTCFVFRWAAIPPEILSLQPLDPATVPPGAPACLAPALATKDVALSALTSMFLHGSIAHLLFNMLFLWVFGNNVEDELGHVTFLVYYLVGGLVAVYAFALLHPNDVTPLLGASGAIAAVLGGYLVLHPRARVQVYAPFPLYLLAAVLPRVRVLSWWLLFAIVDLPAWLVLGIWFATQLFALNSVSAEQGVAYEAHVAGFVAGLVATLVLRAVRPPRAARWA